MAGRKALLTIVSTILLVALFLSATACATQQSAGGQSKTGEQPKTADQSKPTEQPKATAQPTKEANSGQPFKIGNISILTGAVAAAGKDFRDGLLLYVDERGGVLAGHPTQVIVEDSTGDTSTALAKARKLVENDGVNLIFGPLMSQEAYAVAEYANKNKVTLMSVSSADDLTQRQRSDYILRASATSSQIVYPLADYAYNKLGYKKIAVVALDVAMGYEVVGGFQTRFEELGGKITKKIWVGMGVPDVGPYIAQIPNDVDAVFVGFSGGDTVRFVTAYKDYGATAKIPLIGPGMVTDESILGTMGDSALGIVTSMYTSLALKTPENQELLKKFQAKYGRPASNYAENAYSGVAAIDAALKAAGSDYKDPIKFGNAFKQVKLVVPRGPMQIDEYGSPVENMYIRKVEKVEGKLQNTVLETYQNTSQFGHYNPKEYLAKPPYDKNYPPLKP